MCCVQFSDLCCWGRWRCEPPKLHENILHLFPCSGIPLHSLAYIIPVELAIRDLISRLAPDKFTRLLNLLRCGEVPLKGSSHNPWVIGFEGKEHESCSLRRYDNGKRLFNMGFEGFEEVENNWEVAVLKRNVKCSTPKRIAFFGLSV